VSLLFPNVPNLPGVPQLARTTLSNVPTPTQLAGAALPNESSVITYAAGLGLSTLFGMISVSSQNQWGIFDQSGNAVFVPDSILEFEHHPRWRISDFPIQGTASSPTAYATYNKVKLPFDCRVRMSKGSTLAERKEFLKTLDAAADSIALYTIMTPEYSYQNVDIEYYDVVRTTQGVTADGAYFLTEVDVYFKGINPVQAQYSSTVLQNAVNRSALPSTNAGAVLPQPVPLSVVSVLPDSASLANSFGSQ
jgi:hypothetical protein